MIKKNTKKTILILGAGLEQKIAIQHAKRMGLKVVAVDGSSHAPGLRFADVGIVADINDVEEMTKIGRKHKVHGVMAHAVEIPTVVSRVAQSLGLPHLNLEVAKRAINKAKRIQAFKDAGMAVPKFGTANTTQEAFIVSKKIGFPVVIKPVDNAGARGVQKVDDASGIAVAFAEAVMHSKSKSKKPPVLIEQFLQGYEISTESFVYDGVVYTTGFGDRNYARSKEFAPYFIEDGHSVPSTSPVETQKKIIQAAEKAIHALGINWGVGKGDILVQGDAVYVIEMASRTSGGWFAAGTVPLATGVHLIRAVIKTAVGEPVGPEDFKPKLKQAACQRYLIPNKIGIFKGITGVGEARKMPGVKVLQMFKLPKKGDKVERSRNNAERFGHIIAVGKDVAEATHRCECAIKRIHMKISSR